VFDGYSTSSNTRIGEQPRPRWDGRIQGMGWPGLRRRERQVMPRPATRALTPVEPRLARIAAERCSRVMRPHRALKAHGVPSI
jgi:hypothetical protein